MGAPFAQWLGRPSTICFLRRLLATTGEPIDTHVVKRARRICHRRQVHTAAAAFHPLNEINEEDEHVKVSQRNGRTSPIRPSLHESALRMSLNSGVKLLDEETTPEGAYKALWRQINVGAPAHVGKLLVDQPEHRHNMKLWVELLEHRQRAHGFTGLVHVWRGMGFRKVDLPVVGEEADTLWTCLIHACITTEPSEAHNNLLLSIMEHAKTLHARDGLMWPHLYKCLIGRWLRIKPFMARVWHRKFVRDFGMSEFPLGDLAPDCVASLDPYEARRLFSDIHRKSGQRNIYNRFMPEVLQHVDDQMALRWHRAFLAAGDGPSSDAFALPEVQRLFELDGNKSLPMIHEKMTDLVTANNVAAAYPPLTRANMSSIVGEVHGIKPKEVSDTFVAKMFATRAFSVDLVIRGLSFFGVDNLGPLALHEMALNIESAVELSNRLGELRSMGITIDSSIYGRLLQKIAVDGAHLFQALLASDQHPEAYDDSTTQEALLTSFLDKGDMLSAHVALLALSLAGQAEHRRAWNRVLQHYIVKRDYRAILLTMRHMQDCKMPPTKRTLNFLNRRVLPPRSFGKAPSKTDQQALRLQPLQFTTNAYIFAAQSNVFVPADLWRELLKRYGMDLRWQECERLVYWLASWYGRHASGRGIQERRSHYFGMQMLNSIFNSDMRKALVHWAARCAGHSKLLYKGASYSESYAADLTECEPWARGILLLKNLEKHGIETTQRDIRRALTIRLLPLFGPGVSNKRINEEARRHNRLTLADYITHANEIWGVNLFNVDPVLFSEEPPNPSKLLVHIFSHRRRVGKRHAGYADIAGYARSLLTHRKALIGLTTRQRKYMWKTGSFRLIRRRHKRIPL